MADDIKRLKHTAEDIDLAIDILFEVYTREETEAKFAEISEKISELEKEEWKWTSL